MPNFLKINCLDCKKGLLINKSRCKPVYGGYSYKCPFCGQPDRISTGYVMLECSNWDEEIAELRREFDALKEKCNELQLDDQEFLEKNEFDIDGWIEEKQAECDSDDDGFYPNINEDDNWN